MEKIRAKKSMGQNFLVDRNVLTRIVEAVNISVEDRVLEVGPGKGALTALLVERAAQVLAVELDRQLVPFLAREFASKNNVEFVQGDILKLNLSELYGAAVTEEVFPGFRFSVCSYVVSLLRPEILRDLELPRHGLEILPLDGTFTPMPGGDHLWRVDDKMKTRREVGSRLSWRSTTGCI